MSAANVAKPSRIERAMRKRKWNYQTPRNGLRRRAWSLASDRRPWWDWGHRVMALTGTDDGGNWDEPTPPTWWYRMLKPAHMVRTHYPTHPLRTFQVVTDYDELRALTAGLDEDAMYEWRAFCFDGDRELQVGHRYWGGDFYGMTRWESRLLGRYLRMARRHDWFGARSWLYAQGLHAAVYRKKPGSCATAPPKVSGGYTHWLCQLKRGHGGEHRFNNYTWTTGGVTYIGSAR